MTASESVTTLEKSFRRLEHIYRRIPGAYMTGLRFKTEETYLTQEGFPLGTVCWFILAERNGWCKYCCGTTPDEAINAAIEFLQNGYDNEGWEV